MVAVVPIVAPLLVGERRVVFKNITWHGSYVSKKPRIST